MNGGPGLAQWQGPRGPSFSRSSGACRELFDQGTSHTANQGPTTMFAAAFRGIEFRIPRLTLGFLPVDLTTERIVLWGPARPMAGTGIRLTGEFRS